MLQGWNALHQSEEGVMRIPIDSISMKDIEDTWPDKFKYEIRSLQLNIALDGIT